ncbi:hypothetical protein EVAR_6233_1 [Eumeta japonica]|uniref:Uncharacterized protein n=1 Tax=Eumeta variegata TaxID=151549 RepID=A0A4C1T952_EUMVA|nr:hypothetical protein EVAR_6233_1 [Eumeta japonica]
MNNNSDTTQWLRASLVNQKLPGAILTTGGLTNVFVVVTIVVSDSRWIPVRGLKNEPLDLRLKRFWDDMPQQRGDKT